MPISLITRTASAAMFAWAAVGIIGTAAPVPERFWSLGVIAILLLVAAVFCGLMPDMLSDGSPDHRRRRAHRDGGARADQMRSA